MVAKLMMMTVAIIIPSSDFVKLENHTGLLSLSDILVEHLRESNQLTHHVHTIKSKRLIECWTLDTLPHESTSALDKLFGFIYPTIVKLVSKFKRIVEVNYNVHLQTYNVHLQTYNSIIAEEACKKLA